MLSHSTKLTFIASLIRHVRSISLTSYQFCPRNFHKPPEEIESQELDTIAEIESNLFDTSRKQSPQTNTEELLKSYRIPKNPIPAKRSQPELGKSLKSSVTATQKLIDPDLNLSYDKLGRNDGRLSSLLLMANSRKARNKRKQIIIEGRRLILDAIKAGLHLKTVIFSQKEYLAEIKDEIRPLKDLEIVRVPQQDLRSWSTLTTCPGIIAIFQRPSDDLIQPFASNRTDDSARSLPITVICDNVREPNNLGSIIRTCAAIPCDEIIVTKGCCDPWDTKALRGGCGAQFYIRIHDDLTWNQIFESYQQNSFENAASTLVYLAENNVENSRQYDVPVLQYTEIQIDQNVQRCILVIGGETHGISEDAYRFSKYCSKNLSNESSGCLHIPMSPNIDSLNTASALTLLLFELRKRLTERQKQDNEISKVEDTILF